MLKALLQDEGFAVIISEKGADAIKSAEMEKPDIFIVDVLLPDMHGFDICAHVRSKDIHKNSKVIIMAANIDASDAVKAKKCGADDYCVKTGDFFHLVSAVKGLLNG